MSISACSRFIVLVRGHRVADVGADIDAIDVQHRDLGDALIQQHLQRAALDLAVAVQFPGQLVAGLDPDLAGFLVDDVLRDEAAEDVVEGHQQLGHLALVDPLLDHPRRGLVAGLQDHLAGGGIDQIHRRTGAAHALGEEPRDPAAVLFQPEATPCRNRHHDAFLGSMPRA
jgi:hypothetical protein